MSNPDFPGPSWQDNQESFDNSAPYRDVRAGGYRHAASQPYGGADGREYDYDRAGDPYGSARGSHDGYGPVDGYGRDGDPYGSAGDTRRPARSDDPYGRDDGYGGHDASGYRGNGYGSGYERDDFERNGYQAGADGRDGYQSRGSGHDGYGTRDAYDRDAYDRDGYGGNGYGGNGHGGNGYERDAYVGNGYGGEDHGSRDAGYDGFYRDEPGGQRGAGRHAGGARGIEDDGYGDDGYGGGTGYRDDYADQRNFRSSVGDWTSGFMQRVDGLTRKARGRGDETGSRGARGLAETPGRGAPAPKNMLQRLWYGKWWRRWTLKKAALLTGSVAVGVVLIMVAGFFYFYETISVPQKVLNASFATSSTVYFANGQRVGCYCSVNNQTLTEAQVEKSKWVVDAVTAAEDRHFFHEGGVSLTGILRAAKNDLMGGGGEQGGSTITEELVKSYYDSAYLGNLTVKQKIDEVIVSMKLAHLRNKWWVMTHYLNTIYFGAGAWGVQAAAETYFGKPAWKLDVAQAAMLGAIIQSPSGFDPEKPNQQDGSLGSLYNRWRNETLAGMVTDGNISAQTASAQKFPKVTIRPADHAWHGFDGYIMETVVGELEANYGLTLSDIYSEGLQIHTTLRKSLMTKLAATVRENKNLMAQDAAAGNGSRMPSYVHVAAVLEKPGTGDILAFYGGPGYGVKHCTLLHCDQNTILDDAQVGSSFKPYVLTTAVDQGMNSQTSITNSHSPLCIPPADDGVTYQDQLSKVESPAKCDTPVGYYYLNQPSENTPGQNLTVPYATAQSNNASYMDLIHRTGVNNVINMAQTLGVSPATVEGLKKLFWSCGGCKQQGTFAGSVQAALGEGDMTAVDQANMFSTLVSGGTEVTPHMISYVERDGSKLPAPTAVAIHQHAVGSNVAADADYALSFDTNPAYGGTGVPNAEWNRPMMAKTGTLGEANNSSAAWFLGAIPQYALSVGIFTNNSRENIDELPAVNRWTGGYGGAWPATIWHAFMVKAFNNIPVKQLPTPNFTGFKKWVLAPKIKPKCPKLPFGGGGGGHGNGNGNGNGNGKHGNPGGPGTGGAKCQNQHGNSPSPNPSQSHSPGPTNSPSPGPSTSPSVTPSPSTSPSGLPGANPASTTATTTGTRRPGRKSSAAIPALTTAATLSVPQLRKIVWIATTTGLA